MADLKLPQYNRVSVAGRNVHTPKFTVTNGGMKIAKFSIACDEGYGDKKKSHFFECVAFDKTAERIEKDVTAGGMPLLVEGRLSLSKWEKDGQKHSRVEIVVTFCQTLTWPEKEGERKYEKDTSHGVDDDDTPF